MNERERITCNSKYCYTNQNESSAPKLVNQHFECNAQTLLFKRYIAYCCASLAKIFRKYVHIYHACRGILPCVFIQHKSHNKIEFQLGLIRIEY